MKKNTAVWIVVIVIVLIIIGVVVSMNNKNSQTDTSATTSSTSAAAPMIPAPAPTGTVVLNTATNAALGTYLVASNGMTLYQDANDTSGVSNCSGACATAWPPYTVTSQPPFAGAAGITGAVSTITRDDGTMQVTYNGMPLYFWQGDKVSGDVTGQNMNGFSVVTP